jgi:DNA mismatch repair ATPase MutL
VRVKQKNSTTHVDSQSSALVEQPTDPEGVEKKKSTTHVDIQSAALVEQPTDLVTDLSTNAGTETTVVEERNEQSSPLPIAWDTFKSTEDVCREARLERLQMMKRKLDFQRAESYANEVIPSDIGDSPLSVGPSKSKTKGTKINLSKEQFRGGMEIIGQFNMGFILARCQKNHLWILDQHACDEKYNFEKLCRDTIIHEQKLLHPMPLDLSPAEESCILDHIEIFEANGFRFYFDASARIRHRLSLTALPHSGARDGRKAVQFNKDDVSTLCSILMDGASYDAGDGGTGTDGTGRFGNNAVRRYASTVRTKPDSSDKIIARLPKAIAMFASRACRSSIMIGTALSQKEMDRIVRRLADVEHPWNCPHGRPTMRHVGEVLSTFKRDERRAVEYFSGPTITLATMTQEPIDGDEPDGTVIEGHFSSGQA